MQPHTAKELVSLFHQAAAKYPNNIAVDHEDGTLTYFELTRAVDVLCDDLLSRGLRHGNPVILVTAHGTRNIIAMLAILRAGGCCVPVDRDTWSTQRIDQVVETVTDAFLVVNTTPNAFHSERHEVLHLQDSTQNGLENVQKLSFAEKPSSTPSLQPVSYAPLAAQGDRKA